LGSGVIRETRCLSDLTERERAMRAALAKGKAEGKKKDEENVERPGAGAGVADGSTLALVDTLSGAGA
jgi:hypothetical protein